MNGLTLPSSSSSSNNQPNGNQQYYNNSMYANNPGGMPSGFINPSAMSGGGGGIQQHHQQGSYQSNENQSPYLQQQQNQGMVQWQQQSGAGGSNGGGGYDPSSSSSQAPNGAYFNPSQLSVAQSPSTSTFGNYSAQTMNPFANQQGQQTSQQHIDPSALLRMQNQQAQSNGMGGINPSKSFNPSNQSQGGSMPAQNQSNVGWNMGGGSGGQVGMNAHHQPSSSSNSQQQFMSSQQFQQPPNSMSPMMSQHGSPRPGSQGPYPPNQQAHQRRPSQVAGSMPGQDPDFKGKMPENGSSGRGLAAPHSQSAGRTSVVAMPGLPDIHELYLHNAKAQAVLQIRALQSARQGLSSTEAAHSVGLIPVPNRPGVFWTSVMPAKDQQVALSNAHTQARSASQSGETSVSPASILQSRGLVYVPVSSLPPGIKPGIFRPDQPTQGGTIMHLGDARMLGLGPFQGQHAEQMHQIQTVSSMVQQYQTSIQQQRLQQQQQHQLPQGSPNPSIPPYVQSQPHGFSSPQTGAMLPPQSPVPGLMGQGPQQQLLDRKSLGPGSTGLHSSAMAAVAAAGSSSESQAHAPLQASPMASTSALSAPPETALHSDPGFIAAIATSAAAAAAAGLPLPGIRDGGSSTQRSRPESQITAQSRHLQKMAAMGMSAGKQILRTSAQSSGISLFADGIVPPEVGANPSPLQIGSRGKLTLAVTSKNLPLVNQAAQINEAAAVLASEAPKSTEGDPLPPHLGGLLPVESASHLRLNILNTLRKPLPKGNRNEKDEAAWQEMTKEQEKELLRIMEKDENYQKVASDQQERMNNFMSKKVRELWPIDRSWEETLTDNRDGRRLMESREITKERRDLAHSKAKLHWWEKPEFSDPASNHDVFEPFKLLLPADKRRIVNQDISASIANGNGPIASRAVAALNFGRLHHSSTTSMEKEKAKVKESEREKEKERQNILAEAAEATAVANGDVVMNHARQGAEETETEREEDLVPIRLELDIEGWRLRDSFTWSTPSTSSSEASINPELFAQSLCDELGFPPQLFVGPIKDAIATQVSEYLINRAKIPPHHGLDEEMKKKGRNGEGRLDEEDEKWWRNWRAEMAKKEQILEMEDDGTAGLVSETEIAWSNKRKRTEDSYKEEPREDPTRVDIKEEGQVGEDDDVILLGANRMQKKLNAEDLRIIIKLDITVGAMNLIDQFEWDLSDARNSAEDFAESFSSDLGLSGEFRTAIAHSIREQTLTHLNCLSVSGYSFDGSAIQDEDLRTSFLPTLSSEIRLARTKSEVEAFTPRLVELTELEIDKLDKERERELRRKKRQTRGRRPLNLPDREPLKSQRTPAVWGLQNGTLDLGPSNGTEIIRAPRRAAISAQDKIAASVDRSSPGFDGYNGGPPSGPATGGNNTPAPSTKAPKKPRYQNYSAAFVYPGGLGTKEEDAGPKFLIDPESSQGKVEKLDPTPLASPAIFAERPPKATGTGTGVTPTPNTQTGMGLSKVDRATRDLELQHPNMHDGIWHCSNCGIPASLVPSRRKGPLGKDTMCTVCGKFYSRFRRVRETTYSRDLAFHKKNSENTVQTPPVQELNRTPASQNNDQNGQQPSSNQPNSPSPVKRGVSPDLPFLQVGSPEDSSSSRSNSPVSTRSASPVKKKKVKTPVPVSQPPQLSSKIQPQVPPQPPQQQLQSQGSTSSLSPKPPAALLNGRPTSASGSAPPPNAASPPPPTAAPQWLADAMATLRSNYPNDNFDLALRKYPAGTVAPPIPEWRIKCLDCPGKLYTPGPEETLDNFSLHLKNRKHRQAVQERVNGGVRDSNSPRPPTQPLPSTSTSAST